MSGQDAFERILESLYDAMLDGTRWPDVSALIDEACGLTGKDWSCSPSARPPKRLIITLCRTLH